MKAPNMSWMIPYIIVADVKKSADFYQKCFRFKEVSIVDDDSGVATHAELAYYDMNIMIGREGEYNAEMKTPKNSGITSPISIYVYVNDVDEYYNHAVKNGAKGVGEPEDMFWGDRCCQLQDLDNYVWCFGSHLGNK